MDATKDTSTTCDSKGQPATDPRSNAELFNDASDAIAGAKAFISAVNFIADGGGRDDRCNAIMACCTEVFLALRDAETSVEIGAAEIRQGVRK